MYMYIIIYVYLNSFSRFDGKPEAPAGKGFRGLDTSAKCRKSSIHWRAFFCITWEWKLEREASRIIGHIPHMARILLN